MLKLNNISKSYSKFSLHNINIEVNTGDYYILLGKSGSGKSMLLEIIAGIKKQDSGSIFLNGVNIGIKRIQDRNCILVHQVPALFPHITVYNNIAYTLRSRKSKYTEPCAEKIKKIAGFVSIEHLLSRKPGNLSGGEAQRVALARALIVNPDILLLDEPLTAIDVQLRGELLSLLHKINKAGQTIIHVTHNFEEALALSNNVAVLEAGRIIQQGATDEVFTNPRNKFVADLSGMKNFFKVNIKQPHLNDGTITVQPYESSLKIRILSDSKHTTGYLVFSSKDVFLSNSKVETSAVNNFIGTVADIIPHGNGFEIVVNTANIYITALITKSSLIELEIERNKSVWISFKASACRLINSDFE